MFKKPIFLFIATFVLAVGLAFFSSYFIVQDFLIQKVRGAIGINADLNLGNNYKITGLSPGALDSDAISFKQFEDWEEICLPRGGPTYADTCSEMFAAGENPYCIQSWCDINDFDFCVEPDVFPPWGGERPRCFTAETPILMADATYKNIADVQPGDYVLTRESEDSPKLVKAKVSDTYEHWYDRYLVINGSLEVTSNHRMFVDGEWKTAGKIKLGDKLFDKDNQEVVVESIEEVIKKERFKVYNLEIEKYQTYFAGGFYVHNIKVQP